jgi:hypothetical protein
VTAEEVSGVIEEYRSVAKQAVDTARRALEVAARWRRRYRTLKRRTLAKLRDCVAELQEAERFGDDNRVHVRNALEILYDVVKDLEVSEE